MCAKMIDFYRKESQGYFAAVGGCWRTQGKVRAQISYQKIMFRIDNCDRPVFRSILDGGLSNDVPHSVAIEFSCSHQDKLMFVGEFNGEHSFVWATWHACPLVSEI